MEEYLLLGYVVGSFGLDGTVKILSKTHFSESRYQKGATLYLYNAQSDMRLDCKVESFRNSGDFDFVKFDIINTKEQADSFKSCEVEILKSDATLEVGYYHFDDLLHCDCYDEEDNLVGKVIEIREFPSSVNLKIKGKNDKIFDVPFVKFFIKNVDIENKKINIHIIEGML